jgi:hypothetical protein
MSPHISPLSPWYEGYSSTLYSVRSIHKLWKWHLRYHEVLPFFFSKDLSKRKALYAVRWPLAGGILAFFAENIPPVRYMCHCVLLTSKLLRCHSYMHRIQRDVEDVRRCRRGVFFVYGSSKGAVDHSWCHFLSPSTLASWHTTKERLVICSQKVFSITKNFFFLSMTAWDICDLFTQEGRKESVRDVFVNGKILVEQIPYSIAEVKNEFLENKGVITKILKGIGVPSPDKEYYLLTKAFCYIR